MKKIGLVFFLIFCFCIGLGYYFNKKAIKKKTENQKSQMLPDINPVEIDPSLVDSSLQNLGLGHKIQDFKFTNQYGETIGLENVKGKVFIAEFFFTTCGSICPIMNQKMQEVQKNFLNEKKLQILSFTVNPEVDTPEILLEYAKKHNAKKGLWHFLTGDKKQLYKTARRSFFLLKAAEVKNQGDLGSDFIHTNNFVLIDKDLGIKGYYDGTKDKDVSRLISDTKNLLNI